MSRSLFNSLNIVKVFGALLVMASHYGPVYIGLSFYSYGTGCFFVVTGYYALNWERSRGIYYVTKRLVRLYPAFLVAVLAYLLTKQIPLESWPRLITHHLTFLLSTPDRDTVFALNPPFWSLPVFFTFFVLIAFLPRFVPKGWQVVGLLVLAVATVKWGATEWRDGYIELWAVPLHLYAFWLGGWLGHLAHHTPRKANSAFTLIACALMVLIVMCGAYYTVLISLFFNEEGFYYRGVMVFLYGALLWSVLHIPRMQERLPVLNFLGTISFGVYLFHNLPVYWFEPGVTGPWGALFAAVVSLLLAWLSWRFIESPIQSWCKPRLASLH
ncbi:acyltransferase family protein [Vreelandella sp. EE7]